MTAPHKHLGPDELTVLLRKEFPQTFAFDGAMLIEEAVQIGRAHV